MGNRQTNKDETKRAERFTRNVVNAMLKLRGYSPKEAPREVINDAYNSLPKYDWLFAACFSRHESPTVTAKLIQNQIWE